MHGATTDDLVASVGEMGLYRVVLGHADFVSLEVWHLVDEDPVVAELSLGSKFLVGGLREQFCCWLQI